MCYPQPQPQYSDPTMPPRIDIAPSTERAFPPGRGCISVAPMIDWTDRHCRYFHRRISCHARLYTEMVTAPAIVYGPRDRLLAHDASEHPVALQIGGSDPGQLAQAVRLAAPFGYDEINLNLGCPSDRVQSGCFGAVLMKDPDLVARCLEAMVAASPVEVTAKIRLGVDDQDPEQVLPAFLARLRDSGVRRVIVHARKAWLQGLSPKQNREIPPLDHDLVLAMKRAFPDLHLTLNGGVVSIGQAAGLLARGIDAVMIGRAAYHEPMAILGPVDRLFHGAAADRDAHDVVDDMRGHIAAHLSGGGRLHQVTRHMLGLFHGAPGARGWRRVLSEGAGGTGAGPDAVRIGRSRRAPARAGLGLLAQRRGLHRIKLVKADVQWFEHQRKCTLRRLTPARLVPARGHRHGRGDGDAP
jgi:tRNA-dihydrouridine synthase A